MWKFLVLIVIIIKIIGIAIATIKNSNKISNYRNTGIGINQVPSHIFNNKNNKTPIK